MLTLRNSRTLQKHSTRATQSGTPGQWAVGIRLSSRASTRVRVMNQGRTGSRMREEVKVGCMA